MFNISGIVNQIGNEAIGKELFVVEKKTELNERGDEVEKSRIEHTIKGIVQISTAEDDEVIEGILRPMDLICFFDSDVFNNEYLVNYNMLKYDGFFYKIVQVIREIGHIEVLAKKE